jgi:DNA-binding MarR family transcriptional regulator
MSDTLPTREARNRFRSIMTIVNTFRDLDTEMPMQQAMVFLWVAMNEGKTQRDMRGTLDIPSSTASRNLAALSDFHRLGKPGLGLVVFVDHPEDRRSKLLYLSKKGRDVVQTLYGSLPT